jgi:septal ring-binding cell division protein DamX
MKIIRLFLVAALLLMAVGCGKKDSKPKSSAKSATTNKQSKTTDALFEEFFDGTSAVENESQSKQKTAATSNANNKKYDSPRASRDVSFSPNGRYVVQITTVVSPDLASQTAKKLEKNGYPAYVAKVENPTTGLIGTYYRVRIGGFDNVSDAKYFGDDILRPLGYEYWVDNKSNDNVGISGNGLGNYQPQSTNYNTNQNQTARSDFGVEPQPSTQQSSTTGKQSSDNNWDNFQW